MTSEIDFGNENVILTRALVKKFGQTVALDGLDPCRAGELIRKLGNGVYAYKITDMVVGLRVSEESEREGLDISYHGETAYHN